MRGPVRLLLAGGKEAELRRASVMLLRALARGGAPAAGRFQRASSSGSPAVFRIVLGEAEYSKGISFALGAAFDRIGRRAAAGATLALLVPAQEAFSDFQQGEARVLTLPVDKLAAGSAAEIFAGALLRLLGAGRKTVTGEKALRESYYYAASNFPDLGFDRFDEDTGSAALNTAEAVRAGALSAGCRFIACNSGSSPAGMDDGAPCADGETVNIVLPTASGAVWAAAGAGHAGARALAEVDMRSSDGAGEALRWAACAEVPLVCLRRYCTDAEFLGSGVLGGPEAPGAVLAPVAVEDAYHAGAEAFGIAERFHCPVSILLDENLSETWATIAALEAAGTRPTDRGLWAQSSARAVSGFDRYAPTASGVSPRAVPGQEGLLFAAGPTGAAKLSLKHASLAAEFAPPPLEGPEDAEVTLVAWGSALGLLREAMRALNEGGAKVNLMPIRVLRPVSARELKKILASSRRLLAAGRGDAVRKWLRLNTGGDAAATISIGPQPDLERVIEQVGGHCG